MVRTHSGPPIGVRHELYPVTLLAIGNRNSQTSSTAQTSEFLHQQFLAFHDICNEMIHFIIYHVHKYVIKALLLHQPTSGGESGGMWSISILFLLVARSRSRSTVDVDAKYAVRSTRKLHVSLHRFKA